MHTRTRTHTDTCSSRKLSSYVLDAFTHPILKTLYSLFKKKKKKQQMMRILCHFVWTYSALVA